MTPYLADPDVTLYQGDALDILRELPDESVHCVATSPPFYGLRDYGTGRWEGGDADCDHDTVGARSGRGGSGTLDKRSGDAMPATLAAPTCGKCGARRVDQQIGLENTPDEWAARLVEVFREARRVLRRDGSLWVECGDSYVSGQGGRQTAAGLLPHDVKRTQNQPRDRDDVDTGSWGDRDVTAKVLPTRQSGLKPKDLLGQPFLLAFALRADGWYWRGCNIWAKPNAMPESAKDRCTVAHSYVLHFSKSARYFFDGDAVREPHQEPERSSGKPESRTMKYQSHDLDLERGRPGITRNAYAEVREYNPLGRAPRSVWTIPTQGFPEAHFATWPEALARRIILAAVPEQVCSVCGKARERIVEVTYTPHGDPARHNAEQRAQAASGMVSGGPQAMKHGRATKDTKLLGFTDCGHDAYTPGVVLDPFAGSGTTLYVARKHNRRAIGIDLNPEYLEMAARRLAQQSLFALATGEEPAK